MSARVSALPLLRFAEKATPTLENRRSTEAEVAGQPKYWRGPSQLSSETHSELSWNSNVTRIQPNVTKCYVINPSVTNVITL